MAKTSYVSDVFIVDESTVTRVKIGQKIETDEDKTIVVFYFLDSKQYAVMMDGARCSEIGTDSIPYSEKALPAEARSLHDDYLSVTYDGNDVTESFLMYAGPYGNNHRDISCAIRPRYSRMIDRQGSRLFDGEASSAVGILRSDLGSLHDIKIRDNHVA